LSLSSRFDPAGVLIRTVASTAYDFQIGVENRVFNILELMIVLG
jgi:hypothetical protein